VTDWSASVSLALPEFLEYQNEGQYDEENHKAGQNEFLNKGFPQVALAIDAVRRVTRHC